MAASEVFTVPSLDLGAWLPELVLVGTVLLGLLVGCCCGVGNVGPVRGAGDTGGVRKTARIWFGRAVTSVILGGLAAAAILATLTWPAASIQPVGHHFTVDAMAALVRLAVLLVTLLTVLNLPGQRDQRGAVMLVLAALGLILLAEAATLSGFLLAVAVFVVGASLAAWFHAAAVNRAAVRRWHLTSTLGFAMLAFGAVLWCGMTSTLTLAASLDSLALWPFLPPLAVPVILGMLGVGLALILLGEPGRFVPGDRGPVGGDDFVAQRRDRTEADSRIQTPAQAQAPSPENPPILPPVLTGWLTAAPPLALAALLHRLLHEMSPMRSLNTFADLMTLSAAILLLGGYLAALTRRNLERRLAWAAAGQVGLALLGFSVLADAGGPAAVIPVLLLFAAAQLGAMLLAGLSGVFDHVRHACRLLPIMMAAMLLALAALPPLAGWRPRLALLQALLAGNQHLGAGLVILGTLLGCFVYLQPLVGLWRKDPATGAIQSEDRDPFPCSAASSKLQAGAIVALLSAASLLALLLAWGTGLLGLPSGFSAPVPFAR